MGCFSAEDHLTACCWNGRNFLDMDGVLETDQCEDGVASQDQHGEATGGTPTGLLTNLSLSVGLLFSLSLSLQVAVNDRAAAVCAHQQGL